MKLLTTLFVVMMTVVVSCTDRKPASQFNFGTEPYDSAALHVALVPNRDCLPIYYAERTGIYDSLGLHLQIATYPSQMDCDTTLMGRIADGGWADGVRMAHYGARMAGLKVMWTGSQRWELFTCGTLRLREVKSLVGRTVGIARHTAENELLRLVLQSAKVNADNVYYPQINNLNLRAQMLTGDQIDAAMLCWPYTSLAYSEGHKCIYAQRFASSKGCFVMKSKRMADAPKRQQWQLFEKGRRMALDSIRIKGPKAYSIILQKDYGLPKAVADTIKY